MKTFLKRTNILIALIIFWCSQAFSNEYFPLQNTAKTTSIRFNIRIKDGSEGVPFAKVAIISTSNKSLATKVTDITGRCFFDLADSLSGKIAVQINSMGYEIFKSRSIFLDSLNSSETIFILKKNSLQLSQVEIFQKRVVSDGDKLIYTVRQNQFSAGTSVAEVFSKMPGVILSPSGELKLDGRSGVLVLIDGKGELKSQSEQLMMLANLSSDQVEKVEIMSNSSARYEASINSVINVITKKTKGLSNLRTSYAQPLYPDKNISGFQYPSGSMGTNFNFLIGKVRSSFLFNISNNPGLENSTENRTITNISRYNSNTYANFASFYITPNISLDYDINKRSSVALNADISISPSYIKNTTSYYKFYDYATNQLDSTIANQNKYSTDSKRISITGNYKYRFDTVKNSAMYVNFICSLSPYFEENLLLNSINSAPSTLVLSNKLDGDFRIYRASAIFSNLIKRKYLSTEIGLKFNSLKNMTQQLLNSQISSFSYSEQLSALFSSARWRFGKYILITEARGELLKSDATFYTKTQQSILNKYFKIYPNIFLQKSLNNQATVSIGYTKKIQRPLSVYLNPSLSISNYYSRNSGNLSYLPGFTDRLQGQVRYNNFGGTIYYEHYINQRVTLPTSDPFLFQSFNIGKFNSYGFTLSQGFSIKQWFSSNNNFDFSHTYQGNDNYSYSRDSWSGFNFGSSNDFILGKRTRLQASIYYSSKNYSAYSVFGDVFSSSLGVQQLFLKDKLSMNITVEDPLGVKKLRSSLTYPLQFQSVKQLTNNRFVYFQLIYQFKFGRDFDKQGFKDKYDGEIRY